MSGNHWTVFTAFFVTGLFLGIFLVTGMDISPDALAITVGDAIFSVLPSTQFTPLWELLKILVSIIGIVGLIAGIYWVFKKGTSYIISAILGFIAGISLLFNQIIFVISLFLGVLISRLSN